MHHCVLKGRCENQEALLMADLFGKEEQPAGSGRESTGGKRTPSDHTNHTHPLHNDMNGLKLALPNVLGPLGHRHYFLPFSRQNGPSSSKIETSPQDFYTEESRGWSHLYVKVQRVNLMPV